MHHRQKTKTITLNCCIATLLWLSSALAWALPVPSLCFDWDDNIMRMHTVIVIFHKQTHEEVELSTHLFAQVKDQVGKVGTPYEDYEYDYNAVTGSYRYFRDQTHVNHFLVDIKHLLANHTPEQWQGPMWAQFVRALSHPDTAREVRVITTRGHTSPSMMEALRYLQSLGLIRYLPVEDNLHGVNQPRYDGILPRNPADAKAILMQQIIDKLDADVITDEFFELTNSEGTGRARQRLWKYSDDDVKYITTALSVLGKGVAAGRWKDTKIMIFYTGPANTTLAPGAYVLTGNGTPRLATEAEVLELDELHNYIHCRAALEPSGG